MYHPGRERDPNQQKHDRRDRFLAASTAFTRWRNAIKDPARSVQEVFERAGTLAPAGPRDGVSLEAITKVRDASIKVVRTTLIERMPELEEAALLKGDYQDIAKGLRADFPDIADRVAELALEAPEFKHEPPDNDGGPGCR